MWDVLSESKQAMQSATKNNGVTFAIIGSSGCGKTTMIRKVFLDRLYGSMADKKYITTIFTESKESDALQGLGSDVLIDGAGIDEDQIMFYYQTNTDYQKRFNFLAVVDDCIQMKHRNTFEKMFLVMRNTNISSIVSIQYPNLIPKSIRTSVYYCICMGINNNEGVEIMIQSWLSPYLPGKTLRQKIVPYREWTKDHNFYLIDNLQRKCYKVDKNYNCEEIPIITHEDECDVSSSLRSKLKKQDLKRKRIFSEKAEEEESEEDDE